MERAKGRIPGLGLLGPYALQRPFGLKTEHYKRQALLASPYPLLVRQSRQSAEGPEATLWDTKRTLNCIYRGNCCLCSHTYALQQSLISTAGWSCSMYFYTKTPSLVSPVTLRFQLLCMQKHTANSKRFLWWQELLCLKQQTSRNKCQT